MNLIRPESLMLRGCLACLIASLVMPPPMAAAGTGNWDAVRELEPGRRIKVVLRSSEVTGHNEVARGRFASATDSGVTMLTLGGHSTTFPIDSIEQVRIRRPILNRKPPGFGCLIAGASYGWIGGTLGGLAGGAGGFLVFCGLSYVFLGRRGSTRPVYTAVVAPDSTAGSSVVPTANHRDQQAGAGTGATKARTVDNRSR